MILPRRCFDFMEFRDCENQKGAYLNNTCIMMGSPAWEEVTLQQNLFAF